MDIGQKRARSIIELEQRIQELKSAIREFGGKYYDGYENAVDGKAFAVHIHDSVENLMSVLTEDKG